ncbi:MAG: UpxY family transcription antiterminator [Bacteroidales bacterium]|nr:UpxY family transcription antiterminator [Bacteroidales bacterium]MCL2132864.1 UpxY family transcription antiterminator [Bacteroidales bacterium]
MMNIIVKEAKRWRVLYTKPRSEKRAFELLECQDYHVYLPCTTVVRQWTDRKKKVIEPVFKSYLFINCFEKEIHTAVQCPHIIGVVKFENKPAIVREEEIEAIRQIVAGKEDITVVNNHEHFVTGQRVHIISGNLKGLSGILTEFRGARKLAIAIDSLGCNLFVEVAAHHTEPVP